ncbi:MAG: hypothetical protein ABSA75_02240 [Candidatus Bathyarchaeia archaeon]|jgi:DnaJ-class molecular chaperone
MEKKELLGELKEKTQATIIKEFAADGAMIQYNAMGEFKGKFHAIHNETVDVKVKMDGTNEWEVRAIEMTKEGDVIMISGKGTGKQEKAMEGSFKGEVTYMTNSPRLSWLNNTKGWVEGVTKNDEAMIKVWQEMPKATEAAEAPMM